MSAAAAQITADDLETVVHMALGQFLLPAERLDAVATESEKATDPAFAEIARRLSTKLVACTIDDLTERGRAGC